MKTHLNLLPYKHLRRQMILHTAKWWACIYVLAGLWLCVTGWWAWSQNSEQRIALDAVKLQYAPLQRLESDTTMYKQETESFQEHESLVLELSRSRSMLTLLGQLSISANNCGGLVSINKLLLNSTAKDSRDSTKLTLNGVAVHDVAIAHFVAELRESGLFNAVKLTSSGSTFTGKIDSKAYSLECTF